jgi:truncated hemoglobin YjbI
MNALCDVETAQDVKRVVDAFYAKVNCDELLAPIFNEIAKVDWAAHLPTMYRFWDSLLFGSYSQQEAPWRIPAATTETRQYPMAAVAPRGSTASAIKREMAREMLAM